jgi:diaminopropionate ammonia-lyase
MRILAAPLRGDTAVISGESGAAGMGCLAAIMSREDLKDFRDQLGLDGSSRVLLFSTEGDTDPAYYRRVVWDGAWGK